MEECKIQELITKELNKFIIMELKNSITELRDRINTFRRSFSTLTKEQIQELESLEERLNIHYW